jgi:hypothetical protein
MSKHAAMKVDYQPYEVPVAYRWQMLADWRQYTTARMTMSGMLNLLLWLDLISESTVKVAKNSVYR